MRSVKVANALREQIEVIFAPEPIPPVRFRMVSLARRWSTVILTVLTAARFSHILGDTLNAPQAIANALTQTVDQLAAWRWPLTPTIYLSQRALVRSVAL